MIKIPWPPPGDDPLFHGEIMIVHPSEMLGQFGIVGLTHYAN